MAQAKIELKLGDIQFAGEAEASWLEKQLDKVLAYVDTAGSEGSPKGGTKGQIKTAQQKTKHFAGTTASVAAKLGCKAGVAKDVITAAAAQLTLVEGKESFTRAELLSGAKSATAYYKKSVANNLTNTLTGLVKSGDFTEISTGTYSLSAHKREELGKRLAS